MEDEMRAGRAIYYSLFSKLFVFSYESERFDGVREILPILIENSLDEASENALKTLGENLDYNALSDEYDAIFHAPPNPVKISASHYDEGYDSGMMSLRVRNLLAKTKFRRDSCKFKEFEDNFGFVFTMMATFIDDSEFCKELFESVINPCIDEFIESIYTKEGANLYRQIATIMRSFFEFERAIYEVSKPERSTKSSKFSLPRSEILRREDNKRRKEAARLREANK